MYEIFNVYKEFLYSFHIFFMPVSSEIALPILFVSLRFNVMNQKMKYPLGVFLQGN